MGQICSGQKEEPFKASAGDVTAEDLAILQQQEQQQQLQQQHQSQSQQHSQPTSVSSLSALQQQQQTAPPQTPQEKERLKAVRLEQQRLDMIVSEAGRGMISVRSTRGSTGYYDQGFAAALAQHLEATTTFPDRIPVSLPCAPAVEAAANANPKDKASIYARLSQPQWAGIALGPGEGLAGCGGENPNQYMDNVAESLLDSALPAKQRLFAGLKPMVENLL
jgi:chemotaxis protein histidine kinase CheA